MRNIALKLTALVMALLTWLTVHLVTNEQEIIEDIPLRVRLPEGWAVLERSTDVVKVSFRGARDDILLLNKAQVRVEVAVSPEDGGRIRTVVLTEKDVIHPGNARVLTIVPDRLELSLDEQIRKQVAVNPSFSGKPEGALEVESVTVVPEQVLATGSRTLLEEVERLTADTVDLSGRVQSFEVRVPLQPPGPDWVGTIEPERVLLKVKLVEKTAEEELADLPVRLLLPNARKPLVKLNPDVARVRVRGREEAVAALTADQVSVYADATRIEADRQYELKLHVHLPPGVELVDISPAAITVDVGQ